MTGVWKFAVYEVPVKADSAGRPVKTTQFEMRVVAKQFLDTYRQDGLESAKFVESKEVNPTIASAAPEAPRTSSPTAGRVQAGELPASIAPVGTAASGQKPASDEAPKGALAPPTKEVITRAQVQLKSQGFDPGPADGGLGPRTREAVRKFQAARGLPVTGNLDQATLKALGV